MPCGASSHLRSFCGWRSQHTHVHTLHSSAEGPEIQEGDASWGPVLGLCLLVGGWPVLSLSPGVLLRNVSGVRVSRTRAQTSSQRGSDKRKPSPKTMAAFPCVLSTAMPGPLSSSWVTHRICPPGRNRAGKASMASADPLGDKASDHTVGCVPFLLQGTRSLRLAQTPGATAATQRL